MKKYKFNGAQIYENQYHKYLIEIRYLLTTNRGWIHLNKHDQQTVINNAFMRFLNEVQKGKVIADNYNDYKGYLFMITKNAYLAHFQEINAIKRKDRNLYVDEIPSTFDYESSELNNQIDDIIFDELSIVEKIILLMKYEGYNNRYIARKINCSAAYISVFLNKIKQKIFKDYELKHHQFKQIELEPINYDTLWETI